MRLARSNQETDAGKHALPCLTQKASWKGLCADSVEKHEPASDADAAVVESLKALDPNRPIREADSCSAAKQHPYSITSWACAMSAGGSSRPSALAVVRFMMKSNLVGCSTGMSPGLAPRRILST